MPMPIISSNCALTARLGSWYCRVEPKRVAFVWKVVRPKAAPYWRSLMARKGRGSGVRSNGTDGSLAGTRVAPERTGCAIGGEVPFDEVPGPDEPNDALVWFCWRDDGWLRIVPEPEHNYVWLKWKFTEGKWANHYVMVKCWISEVNEGLETLWRKAEEVDQGDRRPTPDKYYLQH